MRRTDRAAALAHIGADGPHDEVAKILPPLTVTDEQRELSLGIPDESVPLTVGRRTLTA
ncbi:hypothetical protein ACFWWC_17095 [Streptomyces sp. NPDC058642]|uniref:hypothetical protein n=1 Tax=Streptomyces sp. NPDC058642 TaxID=3346572 RepID=UPI003650C5D7